MKLLHTADWHVGKALAGRSRADEHRAVLGEIVDIARAQEVDLILVAGDLFDSASPSPEAESIVYDTLLALADIGRVVVIPGNHDNERRLAAVESLFEIAGVTVRPHIATDAAALMVTTPSGEVARIALLPWLGQRHVIKAEQLMAKDAGDLTGDFKERMRRIIALITQDFANDAVNLICGHVTVAGSALGGGERAAQTIFEYYIEASFFPATAHYVALGHIHKAQVMAGACPIRYSGSPLALDFSDDTDDRCVLIVEATPSTPAEVTSVPLKSGRKLRTLRGTVADLAVLSKETGDDYLRVIVEEPTRAGLADEVKDLFPEAVKVIVAAPDAPDRSRPDRVDMTPSELFRAYLAEKHVADDRLVALFDELYESTSA